jgi:heme exporter protein A
MRLIAENLSVARGDRTVIADVSFVLGGGTALVVTGPNGSGKSTLLKTIAGFLKPSAGNVRFEDASEGSGPAACHYLAHANALKTSLTVAENLAFWREFLGAPAATIESALAEVGLAGLGDLPAGYLSAGQKRRVAIARLLISRRPLWLVDEPTAALDAASEKRFGEILRQHLKGGGSAVVATHRPLALARPQRLDLSSDGGAAA